MRAGQLDTYVTVQESTVGQDIEGGKTGSWGTFATVWAGVRPLSGRERYAQDQIQAEVDHEITLRTLAGLTAAMRVVTSDGRTFALRSVLQYPREGRMVCLATERT